MFIARRKKLIVNAALAAIFTLSMNQAANAEFGLIDGQYPDSEGYTLFAPIRGTSAYMVDREGRLINRWQDPDGYSGGAAMYFSPRGTLVRALLIGEAGRAGAGVGGLIREYDWEGNVIWDFVMDDNVAWTHHDTELLPNGNVLITAYERVIFDENGSCRDEDGDINHSDTGSAYDHLIEVKPDYDSGVGGTIEWEWHLCDHLGADDPAKWDDTNNHNYNAIDYHPDRDHILIGCNACNELFIIDHGTSSEEAQGPAGDFIYRWGNPGNYGAAGDRMLGGQHAVRFIKNEFGGDLGSDRNNGQQMKADANGMGNIIAYNNRHTEACANPGPCSAIIEITPPYDAGANSYGPAPAAGSAYGPTGFAAVVQIVVDETGNRNFFSGFLSSGQKLDGNHYAIDIGAGAPVTEFLEVDSAGDVVWHYIPPAFTLNPGRTPGGGKDDDLCMLADAAALPAGGTQWPFRATRYDKQFVGFDGIKIKRGPYLTDVTPEAGLDYGPCPTM